MTPIGQGAGWKSRAMAASPLIRLFSVMRSSKKAAMHHHGDGDLQEGATPMASGHGKGAEGHMGKPVADHGVPLQHQADAPAGPRRGTA